MYIYEYVYAYCSSRCYVLLVATLRFLVAMSRCSMSHLFSWQAFVLPRRDFTSSSSRLYVFLVAMSRCSMSPCFSWQSFVLPRRVFTFSSSRLHVFLVTISRFPRRDFTSSSSRLYVFLVAMSRRAMSHFLFVAIVCFLVLFVAIIMFCLVYIVTIARFLFRVYRRGLSLFSSTTPTHQH